jgi:hypothetical protein
MEKYGQGGSVDGLLVEVKLKTDVWGISDPYTLVSIMSETSIDNFYESGVADNTFIIAGSSVKGDAIIPVITIRGDLGGSGTSVDEIFLHKREFPVSESDHFDWREVEDDLPGFTPAGDGDASGGYYGAYTGSSWLSSNDMDFTFLGDAFDYSFVGKMTPIAMMRTGGSGDGYKVVLKVDDTNTGDVLQSTEAVRVDDNLVIRAFAFSSIDWPPFQIPDRIGHGSNYDVDEFTDSNINLFLQADDETDIIHVDFVWFPNIGGRNYLVRLAEGRGFYSNSNTYVTIDATSGMAYTHWKTSDAVASIFEIHGQSLRDLRINRGVDSQFRMLFSTTAQSLEYDAGVKALVRVQGIYATIFPFSEA